MFFDAVCYAAITETAAVLAEGAMTLPVTPSGGVLFASLSPHDWSSCDGVAVDVVDFLMDETVVMQVLFSQADEQP